MQSMVPYLLGKDHPLGSRIANSQKSFRAEDVEEVGDNRHTTFFEMLGNWSFGDYFRNEQLEWISEFLFEEVGIDPDKLYITVFGGDEKNGLSRDTDSAELWKKIFLRKGVKADIIEIGSIENGAKVGMQEGRIFYYDSKKNWWSRSGIPEYMPIGEPGGPDSEMFYQFSDVPHDPVYGEHCHPNCDCGRHLEIGNNVFMAYKKVAEGIFEALPKKNVDFGGGLERITAAVNNNYDIFYIDSLYNIIQQIEIWTKKRYSSDDSLKKSFRIVADHMRSAIFMIADGAVPSNTDKGYIVRRLLRRSVIHADKLGIQSDSLYKLSPQVTLAYENVYKDLEPQQVKIAEVIRKEESTFRKTLEQGLKVLDKEIKVQLLERNRSYNVQEVKIIQSPDGSTQIWDSRPPETMVTGKWLFDFYQTLGFPPEMTIEELKTRGYYFRPTQYERLIKEFNEEMLKHRELSRTGAEQKFKK